MGSVKHRCGQSPDGPDPVNPRPGPAPADRGADEGQSRFCSQCEVLTARLAEVEGKLETAEGEAYYWRSLCSEDDRVEQLQRRLAEVEAERDGVAMQNDLAAERLREMAADLVKNQSERDRLAQERDFARAQVTGTLKDRNDGLALLWHCRDVFAGECELDDDWFDGFLARFPVGEGDEG